MFTSIPFEAAHTKPTIAAKEMYSNSYSSIGKAFQDKISMFQNDNPHAMIELY